MCDPQIKTRYRNITKVCLSCKEPQLGIRGFIGTKAVYLKECFLWISVYTFSMLHSLPGKPESIARRKTWMGCQFIMACAPTLCMGNLETPVNQLVFGLREEILGNTEKQAKLGWELSLEPQCGLFSLNFPHLKLSHLTLRANCHKLTTDTFSMTFVHF